MKITEFSSMKGESNFIMVRGKKKFGYELELKVSLEGQEEYEGCKCTVKVKELCDDGSDPELDAKIVKKKSKDQATKLKDIMTSELESLTTALREVLVAFRDSY